MVRRNNHLYLDYVSFGVVPLNVDWHWPTLIILGLRVVSREWASVYSSVHRGRGVRVFRLKLEPKILTYQGDRL